MNLLNYKQCKYLSLRYLQVHEYPAHNIIAQNLDVLNKRKSEEYYSNLFTPQELIDLAKALQSYIKNYSSVIFYAQNLMHLIELYVKRKILY